VASLVIESDWILPVESPAIREGFLVVDTGRVVHVGSRLPEEFCSFPKVQLRGGAILPGLINAHCHLELSDIDQPLPVPQSDHRGGSMVGWLDKLMARRMAMIKYKQDIALGRLGSQAPVLWSTMSLPLGRPSGASKRQGNVAGNRTRRLIVPWFPTFLSISDPVSNWSM
jgi:hypothetical protein